MTVTAIKSPGSSRVHAAMTLNTFGQYEPLCGGIKPHMTLSTDEAVNCKRCLAKLEEK